MAKKELLLWHFERLKEILFTLSAPAEKQLEIIGCELTGVIMEADYSCHYLDYREEFLKSHIMNLSQVESLNRLEKFFSEHSCRDENDKFYSFWTEEGQLFTNPDWDRVREIAKRCLEIL